MRGLLFAILLISGNAPEPAASQTISGNELYETCTSDNLVSVGFCNGYLIGQLEVQSLRAFLFVTAVDVGIEYGDAFNDFLKLIFKHCIPSDALNGQLRDNVV